MSIPYRYGTTASVTAVDTIEELAQVVSIPYRYGTTTVFSTFLNTVVSEKQCF